MAHTVTVSKPQDLGEGDGSLVMVTWANLGDAESGTAFEWGQWADRCVHIGANSSSFGSATCVLEGSNDGTNYATLNNAQGTAISVTAAALKQVVELPRYVRPRTSGGTGTAIDVILFCRRQNPMRT